MSYFSRQQTFLAALKRVCAKYLYFPEIAQHTSDTHICEVVRKELPKELAEIIRNYVLQLVHAEKLERICKELQATTHYSILVDGVESQMYVGKKKIVYSEKIFGGYADAHLAYFRQPVKALVAKTYVFSKRGCSPERISYILAFMCIEDSSKTYKRNGGHMSYFRETWEYEEGTDCYRRRPCE